VKRYLVVVRLLHIREQQTLPFVLPFSFPFLGAVQHEVHEVETVVACGVVIGESFADWTRMERILVQTGHRPPPVTNWRGVIARRVERCGRDSSTRILAFSALAIVSAFLLYSHVFTTPRAALLVTLVLGLIVGVTKLPAPTPLMTAPTNCCLSIFLLHK